MDNEDSHCLIVPWKPGNAVRADPVEGRGWLLAESVEGTKASTRGSIPCHRNLAVTRRGWPASLLRVSSSSAAVNGRTGCLSWARPDLWEPWEVTPRATRRITPPNFRIVTQSPNQPVSLGSGAFSIALTPNVEVGTTTGLTAGTLPTLSWASPDGGTTWVVTFSGSGVSHSSIANGVYNITLNASSVTANTGGETMSGNDVATFYRIFGDVIGDGHVTNGDYGEFVSTNTLSTGQSDYLAPFDVDDSGTIDSTDYTAFSADYSVVRYRDFTAGNSGPAGQQTTAWVFGVSAGSGSAITSNDIVGATEYPDPITGAASSSQKDVVTVDAQGQVLTSTDRNGTTHTYSYSGRATTKEKNGGRWPPGELGGAGVLEPFGSRRFRRFFC